MKPTLLPISRPTLTLMTAVLCVSVACKEPKRPQPDMMPPDMTPPDMALPTCGDGEVNQASEACDDGNDIDTDGCTSACELARCGDGLLHEGVEACDDGNELDSDACTSTCELNMCGDGLVHHGVEACDDGDSLDTNACTSACVLNVCGDGIVYEGVEACDDGNDDDRDGCTNACILNVCGDGLLNVGVEACDDGNTLDEDACTSTCEHNVCGDGLIFEGVEACDLGAENADDGACTASCALARCGDGLLRADLPPDSPLFERCDDGNEDDRDACRNSCQPAICGDGVVRRDLEPSHPEFEACDPSADNGPGVECDDECVVIECGNHKTQAGEQCDDGPEGSEACDAECYEVRCGNGRRQIGEACDRGEANALAPDMCRPSCELPRCGDGIHDPLAGEECDEGPDGGELCRASCILRRCGDGVLDPSIGEVCDDGNSNEADACNALCQPHRCGDGVLRAGVLEGEEGYEACDWGEDNRAEPDHCRPSCELPRCGDGVTDSDERCDDGDDEELNGCNSECEVAWCGNGEVDSYLLHNGQEVERCDGLVGCRTEECDDGPEGSDDCDSSCSLRAYTVTSPELRVSDRAASEEHPDLIHFTLEASAFVHFVARESATAEPISPRCDEARWRRLSLVQITEGPLGEERVEVTPSFSGPHLGDEGVCGALQASLDAGRYELSVSGVADEGALERDGRYELYSYMSHALSAPLDLAPISSLERPTSPATRALHHLSVTASDLLGEEARVLRVLFSSAQLNSELDSEQLDALTGVCPPLTFKKMNGIQALSELEVARPATGVTIASVSDARDPNSCAYEVVVREGLYQLELNPALTPYTHFKLSWRDECGDAALQVGEGCDLGTLDEATPCSSLCLLTPLNAPNDGVCDTEEASSEPDCALTYPPEASQRVWLDGYLRERVTQSASDEPSVSFSVAHTQRLQARAFFCSDPSLTLRVERSSDATVIMTSSPPAEGARARCADLDVTLSAGEYKLIASAGALADQPNSGALSYWLELIRNLPLDDHQLRAEGLQEGFSAITSGRARLLSVTLTETSNIELSVYDDERRQCESLNSFDLTLYELDQEGYPVRDRSGQLTSTALSRSTLARPTGTAPLSHAVPCERTALTLSAGRYAVALQPKDTVDDRDPLSFVAQLLLPRLCGNGERDAGEECDDGNLSSGDGCTKRCLKEPACGDGVIDPGEECEGDSCSAECTRCGNGSLDPGEACDDGNLSSGDGCDRRCSLEHIEVTRAITPHTGVVSQVEYEEDTLSVTRPLSERADLYSLELGGSDSLTAWLCAPLLHTIHPQDSSTDAVELLNELAINARLVNATSDREAVISALEADTLDASLTWTPALSVIDDTSDTPSLQACDDPNNDEGVDLGLFGEASPEPMTATRALATQEERAQWSTDERVRCVSLTWSLPTDAVRGAHLLVIESARSERWPLYRDYPLPYSLNLMTWRTLWVGDEPDLGVLSGSIPEGGDRLIKLSAPLDAGERELFEVRTLRDEHFSCPLDTETDLQLLTDPTQLTDPAVSSCELYSRLLPAQPCASTRAYLEGERDLYVYLRPRDPSASLNEYALKVRNVDRCGDGQADWGEQCDDNNLFNEDGCSKVCTYTYLSCGNGSVELDEGEECDDGNEVSGDGCSASCTNERDTLWLTRSREEVNISTHDFTEGDFQATVIYSPVTLKTPLSTRIINPELTLNHADEISYASCGGTCLTPDTCPIELTNALTDVVEGEPSLRACDVSVTEPTSSIPSVTRSYPLNSSGQVFGELMPLASDQFVFSWDTFRSLAVDPTTEQIMIKLAVTDANVTQLVSLDDPPCPEGLDALLSLYNDQGELIAESDDVSATNQCAALFTLIGDASSYTVVVTNLSQSRAPYQLQLSSPDFCGNDQRDFGEECDPPSDETQCSAQCLPLEQ